MLLLIRRATPGPALWLRLRLMLLRFSFSFLLLAKLVDLGDEDPEGRVRVSLAGSRGSQLHVYISIYLSIYLPIDLSTSSLSARI